MISREELLQKCEERIEIGVDEAKTAIPVLERELQISKYKVAYGQTLYVYDRNIEIRQITKVLVDHGVAVDSIYKHKRKHGAILMERTESAGDHYD